MRVKFGNVIYESDRVSCPGEDEGRFVTVKTSNGLYSIDCETPTQAKWLMHKMLTKGYFNAQGVDYNNDQNDMTWFGYCLDKTDDQKVFGKWINQE